MTATSFVEALDFTLQCEGGYSDNPNDPGGSTMRGITLTTYRDWEKNQSLTVADLQNVSVADVSYIYGQNYWNANSCDSLPTGVDLSVFDMSVNAGDGRSAKILQACLSVAEDGVIGPVTLARASFMGSVPLINALASAQLAFYRSLPTYATFGKGWSNRVIARHSAALALLSSPAPVQRV